MKLRPCESLSVMLARQKVKLTENRVKAMPLIPRVFARLKMAVGFPA
jgi:hypothetical protein